MLKLLFVGVLFQVIRCQTLYESVFINDSFLYDGKEKELNDLLDGCENKLREESIKTKEGIRREKELKSKLEASDIAVMVFQGNYFQELEVVKICKMYPSLILYHPIYCQLYYNCSIPADSGLKDDDCKPRLYLEECPYPKLFSKETLKCENYTNVICGHRIEIKWLCKYEKVRVFCDYQLGYHRGLYCYGYFPNCDGYPDGLYLNEHRGDDRYYKKCLDGRTIEYGTCPNSHTWNTITFLHKGKCLSPYELPVNEHKYGQLPSCKGTHDGSYQYPQEEHRCDAYFTCQNGNAKGNKCPGTQLFDVNTGSCQEGKNIDCYI
uniref:Chitin-binding type-2 domain-containing protein n=1 Tax=Magallana gigas TaxID=29159 RepID=A0A8W8LV34_MAGGI|nr:uncharacterized protein LOC105326764 isoform X1 [Crassostrea gigas]